MKRRDFLKTTAAIGALAVSDAVLAQNTEAPAVIKSRSAKPVVISSNNGNFFKNGGSKTCVALAYEQMMQGKDVLQSLIAGVNIVELDPEDPYVGYGGFPNAEGVVQLDSSCMHGPQKRAGGVACLEGIRTPSLVAHAIMETTDHHLLVGKGAQNFARNMGFKIEDDLNTDYSRKAWLEWKRRIDPSHYLDPEKRSALEAEAARKMAGLGLLPSSRLHGTINCDGINAKGEICGVTTTSGLPFKIPGRVGDSPILGAGLYVDGDVGVAGSTGRGEANLFGLCSFLIVEKLRGGAHPKDAGMEALRRVRANTVEKRLRKEDGDPNFQLQFYIINARGEYAGVAMYGEDEDEKGYAGQTTTRFAQFSICDDKGPRTLNAEALLAGTPQK